MVAIKRSPELLLLDNLGTILLGQRLSNAKLSGNSYLSYSISCNINAILIDVNIQLMIGSKLSTLIILAIARSMQKVQSYEL